MVDKGLRLGRQLGRVAESASLVPPCLSEGVARPVEVGRDIERLLHWVYRDQMAHVDGLDWGSFEGYGPGSIGYGAGGDYGRDGPRPAQYYAAQAKLHPYAGAVHGVLRRGFADDARGLDRLIVHARSGARPDIPIVRLGPRTLYAGRALSADNPCEMVMGPRQQVRVKGKQVWVQPALYCKLERSGPDHHALVQQRWEYRYWREALGLAREKLVAAGHDVSASCAPELPLEWWEK